MLAIQLLSFREKISSILTKNQAGKEQVQQHQLEGGIQHHSTNGAPLDRDPFLVTIHDLSLHIINIQIGIRNVVVVVVIVVISNQHFNSNSLLE